MPAANAVALILGAGPSIGHAVAQKFACKGYKVALASRSMNPSESSEDQLHIPADFSNSDDVVKPFRKTNEVLGIPSVVVYNVSASTLTPPHDPFSLPLEAFNRDVNINIISAFVAAQQAVSGFAGLPASAARTFIYTGNILNVSLIPAFIDQGIGKSAGTHMIWAASAAYKNKGYKQDEVS